MLQPGFAMPPSAGCLGSPVWLSKAVLPLDGIFFAYLGRLGLPGLKGIPLWQPFCTQGFAHHFC